LPMLTALFFETLYRRRDGTIYDVEISHNSVEFAGEKLVLGICRDISQRKAAAHSLEVSEERLRLALAASQMGVLEWDVRTDTVYWSPECYNIFGVNSFDGKLESLTDMVHPEDRNRAELTIKQAMEKGTIYQDEFRIIQPGGNVRWVSSLGKGEHDEEGKLLRFIGNVKDVTERKQDDSERERMIRAIEQIKEVVVITDDKGTIQYVNPAFVAVTGYTPLEAIGQNCHMLKSGRRTRSSTATCGKPSPAAGPGQDA